MQYEAKRNVCAKSLPDDSYRNTCDLTRPIKKRKRQLLKTSLSSRNVENALGLCTECNVILRHFITRCLCHICLKQSRVFKRNP